MDNDVVCEFKVNDYSGNDRKHIVCEHAFKAVQV